MRPVLRSGVGVIALLSVVAALAACDLVLGLNTPIEDLSKVALFCECGDLSDQRGGFSERCATEMGAKTDAELIALAEDGCDSCGDAVEAGTVQQCYAAITGAAAIGSPCTVSADCESFACCTSKAAFTEGELIYNGQCCDLCYGCSDVEGAAANPAQVCADALVVGYAAYACLCSHLKGLPMSHECRSVTKCGASDLAGCTRIENQPCIECLYEAGACIEELTACSLDPTRPVTP